MTDDHGRGEPLENRAFVLFVAAVTLALAWTLWAFAGPILWAVVLAVVFAPLRARLERRWPGHPGRAAGVTLLVIAAGIVLPVLLLGGVIGGEAAGLVGRLQSGQINLGHIFQSLMSALPSWAADMAQKAGLTDADAAVQRVSAAAQGQFRSLAGRALSLGGDVLGMVLSLVIMLYLAFFLLRDGESLSTKAGEAVPLRPERRAVLADRFVSVVRATVKGTVVVAVVQGALGGVVMALLGVPEALLWAVVMAFCALIPAIGTGLVWIPVSLYLLASGHTWQGIVMALCGAILIGGVDNVLKPILVGHETKLPDALVLVTTLGGLTAFGFSGLVLGPVSAALFLAAWEMVREDRLSAARPGPHPTSV